MEWRTNIIHESFSVKVVNMEKIISILLTIFLVFFTGSVNSFSQKLDLNYNLMNNDLPLLPNTDAMFEFHENGVKRNRILPGIPRTENLYGENLPLERDFRTGAFSVTAKTEGGKVTITPKEPSSTLAPKLYPVIESLSTSLKEKIIALPGSFFQDRYNLKQVVITKESGNRYKYDIEGTTSLGIAYFGLEISAVTIHVNARVTGNDVGATTFTIDGTLDIGPGESAILVTGNETHAVYNATIKKSSPFEFADRVFGSNNTDQLLSFVTEQKLRDIFETEIPELKLIAVTEKDKRSQYLLHTEHVFAKNDINLQVYAMISKDNDGNFAVSFFSKVSTEASLKKIVDAIANITNFPEIELFEGLPLQAVASVSSREVFIMSTPVLDEVLEGVFFDNFSSIIPKGFAVHFSAELKEKLKTCSGAHEIPNFPDTSTVSVLIAKDGIDFIPSNVTWPVTEIVTCLFESANDFFTSAFFREKTGIQFNKIYYNRTDGGLEVDVVIEKEIHIFSSKFMTINTLDAKVKRENSTEKVNFSIAFNTTVDDSVYTGNISRQGDDHNIKLTATVLPISKILSLITFPSYQTLSTSFASVIDFGIKDFLLEAKWNEDSTYRLAGKPYIYGFDKVSFEAVIWTRERQRNMAFGIKFDQISINDILQSITGTNTTTGAWLSGIDIVVVVATDNNGLSESVDAVAAKKKGVTRSRREIIMDDENQTEAVYKRQFATGIYKSKGLSRRRKRKRGGKYRKIRQRRSYKASRSLHPRKNKPNTNKVIRKYNGMPRNQSPANTPPSTPQASQRQPGATPSTGTSQTQQSTNATAEEITKMDFIHDAMKSIAIAGGVTVKMEFNVPGTEEGCRGDEVCNYIRERMNETKLTIIGAFSKESNGLYKVNLTANIDTNIQLTHGGKLYFTNARLEIIIFGINSSLQIEASLEYRISEEEKLTFTGLIQANSKQLKLEFTMGGIWKKPFGIEWMGFGDLAISAVFEFKAPSLVLGFGGTLLLGKIDDENVIRISVYFGFKTTMPAASYIYGNISEITIGKISEVFDLDISSSDPVKETGFPEGLVFSYNGAATEQKIKKFDITVKKGLYLKGKINILGYSIAGELEFNDGKLKLAMDLDPISIADEFIIIQRNSTDEKNGPKIDIEISRDPVSVSFNISGYIYVCGMGAEVIIQVSNENLFMRIEGKMFDAFTASVELTAAYGDLAKAMFTFKGCISSDLSFVRGKIADFLLTIQKKAKELSENAERVKNATEEMQARIMSNMNQRNATAHSRKKLALEQLQTMKAEAEQNQKDCDVECPVGCRSGLIWKKECFWIFGYPVGCPSMSDCAYKGQSALCLAGCHIKNTANAVVDWAKEVLFKVKNAFISLQDFIVNAVEGIKIAALELGKKMITVFQSVTEAVGNMSAIVADRVREDESLLNIKHICVTGGAAAGKSACVELDVDLSLFGTRINFKKPFCIGKNFLDNAAKSSVAGKYPKAEQIEDRSKEFDNEVEHIEEQKEDIVKKEEEVDESANKEESELEERSNIPGMPRRHTNGGIFDINMINSTIISKFDRSLPKVDTMIQNDDNLVTLDGDHSIAAAFFKDNKNKSTCSQTRSIVHKYGEITNGAKFLAENAEQQRRRFKKENKLYNMELEFMKNNVDKAEKTQNITFAERQELRFWYERAQSKVDYWADSVENQLNGYDKKVMKTYKRQLDTIVGEHTKRDTIAYMGGLVEKGESLIRRSGIPGDEADKRSGILKAVHEGLKELLQSKGKTLPATKKSLDEISGHIDSLKSYHNNCT